MERILLSTLSVLALSGVVTPATFAAEAPIEQKTVVVSSTLNRPISFQHTPNSLVTAAYRGGFVNQGIPGHNRLYDAYSTGRVMAEDLIRVAIAQGQLSSETLSNLGYINTVETELEALNDTRLWGILGLDLKCFRER